MSHLRPAGPFLFVKDLEFARSSVDTPQAQGSKEENSNDAASQDLERVDSEKQDHTDRSHDVADSQMSSLAIVPSQRRTLSLWFGH